MILWCDGTVQFFKSLTRNILGIIISPRFNDLKFKKPFYFPKLVIFCERKPREVPERSEIEKRPPTLYC